MEQLINTATAHVEYRSSKLDLKTALENRPHVRCRNMTVNDLMA
jgi:hypothetical protein